MYEVNEVTDLTGIAEAFPNARKVTVDMPNRTLYVFTGRRNKAITVTGTEFDKLVKVLPAGEDESPDESQPPHGNEPPADVEPVEAVISVVKEPPAKGKK